MSALSGRRGRGRPHLQAEGDIVGHRHVPEQRIMLEDEADIALLHGLSEASHRRRRDAPAVGMFQPGDQPQQRRLAGTGRAEQRDQFARADVQETPCSAGNAVEVLASR
jgi:hypothetical protein